MAQENDGNSPAPKDDALEKASEPAENPTPEKTPENAPAPAASANDEQFQRELEQQLERDRAELKAAQAELQKFRQAEKERQEAELSELEKTKKHLEEAQSELERQTKRNQHLIKEQALQRAALDRGVKRQSAIARLVDWSAIELNDDGDVVGLDEALDAVQESVPELFPSDDVDDKKSTSSPESGGGKQSDRTLTDDEGFDSERELGRAIRKRVANKKNSTRL